jgi:purine-cytosine permease-like protein
MGAWLPAAFIGLSFVNLPGQFVGPLGNLAGELDLSVPVSLLVGGLLYFVLLTLHPEAEGVYGPNGRFLVRGRRQAARGVGAPAIQPKGY